MNVKKFERKIWDINKKVWHETNFGESHHTCKRVGVRLCCMLLLKAGEQGHENNIEWVKRARKEYRPIEKMVLRNYIKGIGCRVSLTKTCDKCAMPKIGK